MRTDLIRKTALTAAGLAFTGGAIAGPITAAYAAPDAKPTTQTQTDRKGGHGERELGVRYEAQPNFYYCGPAATRNALSVQGKNINVDDMAKEMGTTEAGTNSINDITPVLNKETGKADAYHSPSRSAAPTPTPSRPTNCAPTSSGPWTTAGPWSRTSPAPAPTPTASATPTRAGTTSASSATATAATPSRSPTPPTRTPASYQISVEHLADWIATRGYATS